VIIGTPMPATMRVVQIEPAPMPTFTASTPRSISASVASPVATLPAQRRHHVEHALRVAVRGVDDEHVDVGVDQRLGALHGVAGDPDGGAAAQPAQRVLAGVRILDRLLDVLDRDQALQPEVLIDHQQLLDLGRVQDLARLIERGADRDREQPVLGHHLVDGAIDVGLEAQVAVGEDADQAAFLAAVVGDRDAGDAIAAHQLQRLEDAGVGGERDRVDDHPALRALDAIDLGCLLLDREVLVDDAEPALLRHRDGHLGLGDGVHRRAQQRHVEADVTREVGADVDLSGQHGRVARDEQDVVEGEGDGERRVEARGKGSCFLELGAHRLGCPMTFLVFLA
jgi:hypothetical protein